MPSSTFLDSRAAACAAGLLAALTLGGCTRARTQIVLRVRTDMSQGPGAELTAIAIRARNEGDATPRASVPVILGTAAGQSLLPSELGLVPTAQRDGRIVVEVDAIGPSGVLFTHRVTTRFVPERTLLLDVLLAARCKTPPVPACTGTETCGAQGCEPSARDDLPAYAPSDAQTPLADLGATLDAGSAIDGATPEAGATDAGPSQPDAAADAGPTDLGPPNDTGALDDAARDLGVRDAGPADLGPEVDAGPPVPTLRPVAPSSTAFVTSPAVRFRWSLEGLASSARLEVCRDRACTLVARTVDVPGTSTTVTLTPDPLPSSQLYYWRVTGLSGTTPTTPPSPVWEFSLRGRTGVTVNTTWGTVANFDGDPFADVVVGASASNTARIHAGSANASAPLAGAPTTTVNGTDLGRGVAAIGDVDGDGLGDLAVSAGQLVLVFHGRRGGFPQTLLAADANAQLPAPGESLGDQSVAAAGDVNGDGYGDVIVGRAAAGNAALYLGSRTGLPSTPSQTLTGAAGFGASVAGTCDVDADGRADVIVGSPSEDRALVYLGTASGLATTGIALTPPTGETTTGAGTSVACAGDVNGDGRPDVIVGAPSAWSAYVYLGAAPFVATAPNGGVLRKRALANPTLPEAFGKRVSAGGDLNGDGFGDVLVVAPDVVATPSGAQAHAFSFLGSATGLPVTPVGMITAHQRSVATSFPMNRSQTCANAGDLNGDGFDDGIFGAPLAGQLYVYLGAVGGYASATTQTLQPAGLTGFGGALALRCLAPRRSGG